MVMLILLPVPLTLVIFFLILSHSSEVGGQWSDQEPISSRLATGKSPAGYWSTVIGIFIFMYDNYGCMHGMYIIMYVSHFIFCHTLLHMYTVCVSVQHLGMLWVIEVSLHTYVVALA